MTLPSSRLVSALSAITFLAACLLSQAGSPILHLAHLSPLANALVDSSTEIVATLNYSVPDTRKHPGPFTVGVMFASTQRYQFSMATAEEKERGGRPQLAGRSGRVELRYPLALVWRRDDLKRPIQVFFYLWEQGGPPPNVLLPPGIELGGTHDVIAQVHVEYRVK